MEAYADRLDVDKIREAHDLAVEARFGKEVSTIVDGVTKLGKVRFNSATEQQVENYRKMLLSMAEDARVILVKLADRLHNMRTLEHLPPPKRARIAQRRATTSWPCASSPTRQRTPSQRAMARAGPAGVA
ncbi:MAG: HD domain-containing protein [Longimicrobiales bacterium]